MNLKKSIILLVMLLVFCFPFNIVSASTLDDNILNDKIENITFDQGKAIVMGNLNEDFTVDMLLSYINLDDEFISEYDINNYYVKVGDEISSVSDIVSDNMVLVFEFNDGTTLDNSIVVVGDLNNDGIITDDDVLMLIDDILMLEEERDEEVDEDDSNIKKDINRDSSVSVVDVTYATYSLNKGNWEVGEFETIDAVSAIEAKDIVFVGDTLEVVYKLTGLNVGLYKGISGKLNYDKTLLELDSVFVNCESGYLNDDGKFLYILNEDEEDIIITFSFKALAVGDTSVDISSIEAALDGVKIDLDSDSYSKDILIDEYGKGGDEEEDSISASTTTDNSTVADIPVQTSSVVHYHSYIPSYVSLSSNNYIKSLSIKNQKIDFDRNVFEYNIIVGNKVKSLDLTVILEDEDASYVVIGNENFKTGKNVVTIRVTAPDGSTRDYVINVNKMKESDNDDVKDKNNISKYIIIGLIVLIIAGLVYVIFKDDEEDLEDGNKDSKK